MRSFLFKRGFILPVTVTGIIPLAIVLLAGAWRAAVVASMVPAQGDPLRRGLHAADVHHRPLRRHHGSLAPWNPPTQMVVVGPYRYGRNPMITGIYCMLLGEAVALRSPWVAAWFVTFAIGMGSHIVCQEEPLLGTPSTASPTNATAAAYRAGCRGSRRMYRERSRP